MKIMIEYNDDGSNIRVHHEPFSWPNLKNTLMILELAKAKIIIRILDEEAKTEKRG